VELLYPQDTLFSESDLSTICFNSFPERHDGEVADMFFSFTVRNTSSNIKISSALVQSGSSSVFHGVSVFRQSYDTMSKRRFDQKSLVVISALNFTPLFMNMLRVIAASSAIGDPTPLETACAHIAAWPPPTVGRINLPFMGTSIELEMCVVLASLNLCYNSQLLMCIQSPVSLVSSSRTRFPGFYKHISTSANRSIRTTDPLATVAASSPLTVDSLRTVRETAPRFSCHHSWPKSRPGLRPRSCPSRSHPSNSLLRNSKTLSTNAKHVHRRRHRPL
jgi:hypothetical protein